MQFKQLCFKCKKNYVLVTGKEKFVKCYDCEKHGLAQEIKNSKMKKLFDIPVEFYKENIFLRNIKLYYLKFGKLSEKQIEAFKKTANELRNKE